MDAAVLPSPAELVELPALRDALVELSLIAVASGVLGAFVVLRRLAFFSHAVGTATFPGLVVAEAVGFSATIGGLAAALAYAGGVERAGRAARDPGDTATALVLVGALAAGIVLASDVFESGAAVDRLLFGTALGLGAEDLAVSAAAAALALAATVCFARTWTAVGFDPGGSRSLGVPAARADLLLLALVSFTVVASLPAVGALLVASLFVVPAAIARLFARSVPELLGGAVVVAGLQGGFGLYVSVWLDVPPGPAVAALGAAAYGLAAGASAARGKVRSSRAEAD